MSKRSFEKLSASFSQLGFNFTLVQLINSYYERYYADVLNADSVPSQDPSLPSLPSHQNPYSSPNVHLQTSPEQVSLQVYKLNITKLFVSECFGSSKFSFMGENASEVLPKVNFTGLVGRFIGFSLMKTMIRDLISSQLPSSPLSHLCRPHITSFSSSSAAGDIPSPSQSSAKPSSPLPNLPPSASPLAHPTSDALYQQEDQESFEFRVLLPPDRQYLVAAESCGHFLTYLLRSNFFQLKRDELTTLSLEESIVLLRHACAELTFCLESFTSPKSLGLSSLLQISDTILNFPSIPDLLRFYSFTPTDLQSSQLNPHIITFAAGETKTFVVKIDRFHQETSSLLFQVVGTADSRRKKFLIPHHLSVSLFEPTNEKDPKTPTQQTPSQPQNNNNNHHPSIKTSKNKNHRPLTSGPQNTQTNGNHVHQSNGYTSSGGIEGSVGTDQNSRNDHFLSELIAKDFLQMVLIATFTHSPSIPSSFVPSPPGSSSPSSSLPPSPTSSSPRSSYTPPASPPHQLTSPSPSSSSSTISPSSTTPTSPPTISSCPYLAPPPMIKSGSSPSSPSSTLPWSVPTAADGWTFLELSLEQIHCVFPSCALRSVQS